MIKLYGGVVVVVVVGSNYIGWRECGCDYDSSDDRGKTFILLW